MNIMKKSLLLSLLMMVGLAGFSQEPETAISIIPEPVNLKQGAGHFTLPAQISISIPDLPELKETSLLLKQKLAANRLTTPLFDTARWTRHAEEAYARMHARSQRGEAPATFAVAPIA